MPHSVKIAASQEELCRIFLVRYAVYVDEMKFSFPFADHEKKMLYDKFDESAIHFYEEDTDSEEVIGIYRLNIIDPENIDYELESRYQISSFLELGLKMGYSSKMMTRKDRRSICTVNEMLRKVFHYGIEREYYLNFIDCSPPLIPFYERIGFRKYASNFIDPVLGEKTPMVLFIEDLDHLQKMKSPLYRIGSQMGVKKKSYTEWLENIYELTELEHA